MICKGWTYNVWPWPSSWEPKFWARLNFVLDTPSHYALPLCEIWLNSLQLLLSYCGHTICKWQTFGFGLWPWPWSWELNLHDKPSHFVLSFCEIWLNSLYWFLSYGWHTISQWQTSDLGLWSWPWLWEINFVRDTPSHFALCFCKIWLNSLYPFLS